MSYRDSGPPSPSEGLALATLIIQPTVGCHARSAVHKDLIDTHAYSRAVLSGSRGLTGLGPSSEACFMLVGL